MKQLLKLKVNGLEYEEYVEPWLALKDVLRNVLGLTGTKEGCISGYCGSCVVLVDGMAVRSCLLLARQAEGREITTVEGLARNGELDPVQKAFIDHFAVQCGYCTPGMLLGAKALLTENPHPTEEEVKEALKGHLCRCTGYKKIVEAVVAAGAK